MPLQCSITQPSGAVATYHVVASCNATFPKSGINTAILTYNSYLSAQAFLDGDMPFVGLNQMDISPLVNNPPPAAPSLLYIIEQYLLTTATFKGATQVS